MDVSGDRSGDSLRAELTPVEAKGKAEPVAAWVAVEPGSVVPEQHARPAALGGP